MGPPGPCEDARDHPVGSKRLAHSGQGGVGRCAHIRSASGAKAIQRPMPPLEIANAIPTVESPHPTKRSTEISTKMMGVAIAENIARRFITMQGSDLQANDLGHPRRGGKPEFKLRRYPPLEELACSICFFRCASHLVPRTSIKIIANGWVTKSDRECHKL